jgi:hypothetical protein
VDGKISLNRRQKKNDSKGTLKHEALKDTINHELMFKNARAKNPNLTKEAWLRM